MNITIYEDVEYQYKRYKEHKVKVITTIIYEIEDITIGSNNFELVHPTFLSWQDTKEYIDKFTDNCCVCGKEFPKDLNKFHLGRCDDCYKDLLKEIRKSYVDAFLTKRGESK